MHLFYFRLLGQREIELLTSSHEHIRFTHHRVFTSHPQKTTSWHNAFTCPNRVRYIFMFWRECSKSQPKFFESFMCSSIVSLFPLFHCSQRLCVMLHRWTWQQCFMLGRVFFLSLKLEHHKIVFFLFTIFILAWTSLHIGEKSFYGKCCKRRESMEIFTKFLLNNWE